MKVKIGDMLWTKTNGKHALGSRYEYFLQLNRTVRWLRDPRVIKLSSMLHSVYGESYTREEVVNEKTGGVIFYRRIPNENWYVDTARHRIYVAKESTLTYMLLMN